MSLPPPPQSDDPIIMQFRPQDNQWELTDENINRIDPDNCQTILHNYCKFINTSPLGVYRYLIETKGCDVNAQDDDKNTPIHLALRYFNPNDGGGITVLHYLLNQKGINGNIKGQYGYTLLHQACKNINVLPLDTFKMLIEAHGANVNAQDDNQYTPLYFAIHHFDPSNDGDNTNVLLYLLSQKGINGNIKDQNGCTVLHTACSRINKLPLDVFKLLIENGDCDVIAQDDNKNTPIHLALGLFNPNKGGNINVLTYLLSRVHTDLKGQNGYTLLHEACKNINALPINAFKVLVEAVRCDVNVQANDNDTPFHYAFDNFNPRNGGNLTVLNYLASHKDANVNIKTQKGYNVLHLACINKLLDSKRAIKLKAENDTIWCQIVEVIIERCVQQVLDELTS